MSKKEVKGVAYTCDYCKKDITKVVRIRCAECSDFDLCTECFSVGVEVNTETNQHRNNHAYYVIVCLLPAIGVDTRERERERERERDADGHGQADG
jgi:predicted ATP-dependent serine protease